MDVLQELEKKIEETENVLSSYLPKEEGYQKTIMEAMNYSINAGGKRLRPILMRETYRLFGGSDSAAIEPFMAAIEMIHTYSLVHDDLPAMDNDEYRRGKKTTHIVYGHAMGILAGDALLNYAFETALEAFHSETDYRKIIKALEIMAGKAGIYGMIGGQVVDVESEDETKEKPDLSKIEFIHRLKTSAMIESAMMIGAVLAGADEEALKTVEISARQLGLAFQIQDDILDVTSTMEELGKPIHSDEKNNKTTYVTLVGIEKAAVDVECYSNEAIKNLEKLEFTNEFLVELMKYMIHRRK